MARKNSEKGVQTPLLWYLSELGTAYEYRKFFKENTGE
jgi:hypothetical protein